MVWDGRSSNSNTLGWGETLVSRAGKEEQARKEEKNQNFPSATHSKALTHFNSEDFAKLDSNISLLFFHFRHFFSFLFSSSSYINSVKT